VGQFSQSSLISKRFESAITIKWRVNCISLMTVNVLPQFNVQWPIDTHFGDMDRLTMSFPVVSFLILSVTNYLTVLWTSPRSVVGLTKAKGSCQITSISKEDRTQMEGAMSYWFGWMLGASQSLNQIEWVGLWSHSQDYVGGCEIGFETKECGWGHSTNHFTSPGVLSETKSLPMRFWNYRHRFRAEKI
jgi:hypothetical protein